MEVITRPVQRKTQIPGRGFYVAACSTMMSETAQNEQELANRVRQSDGHVIAEDADSSAKPRIGHGLAVREKLEITAKEQEVFDTLLATVERFELGTQLRVAGGWVRDKVREARQRGL